MVKVMEPSLEKNKKKIIKKFFYLFIFFNRFYKTVGLFIITVRAVFTATFAAIAALQVIFFCKNLITLFIIIKVFMFFDGVFAHGLNQ